MKVSLSQRHRGTKINMNKNSSQKGGEKVIKMDDEKIKSIVVQLVRGLEFLHSKNIIHRDFRDQNILYDEENLDVGPK